MIPNPELCFNTQPPEGGWLESQGYHYDESKVSTRSRPKAAGHPIGNKGGHIQGFNTQPPEGGWLDRLSIDVWLSMFQHAAARRRLVNAAASSTMKSLFQHAAARRRLGGRVGLPLSQQSFQHAAARRRLDFGWRCVNTAGGFQHAAARRRLDFQFYWAIFICKFQHAAARRRLEPLSKALLHQVSQP